MSEPYLDCNGVAFADYRALLPGHVADWPPAHRVEDKIAVALFRDDWNHCQLCGRTPPGTELDRLHVHHIVGGSRGRSNEATNFIRLCPGCHEWAQGCVKCLPTILWAKWRTEREAGLLTISWVRLALLRRQHLPGPQPSEEWIETYEINRRKRYEPVPTHRAIAGRQGTGGDSRPGASVDAGLPELQAKVQGLSDGRSDR